MELQRKEKNRPEFFPLQGRLIMHILLGRCKGIEPTKQALWSRFALRLSPCPQAIVSDKLDMKRLARWHASIPCLIFGSNFVRGDRDVRAILLLITIEEKKGLSICFLSL
jgi:hypothetical protein